MSRRPTRRQLRVRIEALENRCLLAGDAMHNFLTPQDVNDDMQVTPIDALAIINELNDRTGGRESGRAGLLMDVNDDNLVSPLDALRVINFLNSESQLPTAGSDTGVHEVWLDGDAGSRAKVEFEQEGVKSELQVKLVGAAAATSYSVRLNDTALGELMTDDKGRGRLTLSSGDDSREHLPLPADFAGLDAGMSLAIGDLIAARLADGVADDSWAGEDRSREDNSEDDHSSHSSSGDVSSDASSSSDDTSGDGSHADGSADDHLNDDNSSNDELGDDRSGDDRSGDDSRDGEDHDGEDRDGEDEDSRGSQEVQLKARLSAGSVVGEVEYEVDEQRGQSVRKFEVEIEHVEPGATLDVFVDGQLITSITANERGQAKVEWSTLPGDEGGEQMPSDFPELTPGMVVTVGDLSGILQDHSDA